MHIETMIAAAQQRLAAKHAEIARERATRLAEDLAAFQLKVFEFLGDHMIAALGMTFATEGDNSYSYEVARFVYRDRTYHLTIGRDGGYLVRQDPRGDGDERPRPNTSVYLSYRAGMEQNQDSFLLALADLDAMPDEPPPPERTAETVAETRPETYADRLFAVLSAIIDSHIDHRLSTISAEF